MKIKKKTSWDFSLLQAPCSKTNKYIHLQSQITWKMQSIKKQFVELNVVPIH